MERVKKIRYIDNDPSLGIKYDWDLIAKEYKKLGVPPEYDITDIIPLGNDALKWYILTSERSVGKTTNILLIGMVMNRLYGTVIQLIRHYIDKASYYDTLFNSIINYNQGQYIKKLTDGKYDSVRYYSRSFYYGKTDPKTLKVVRSGECFCVALAANECYNLCSFYEAPLGDWIVLDECFNDKNTPEEFVRFCHLIKTIVRDRMSDKIIVLGNDIDINNIWYRQLTVQNIIRTMKKGESKIIYTADNMPLFVSFMENRLPVKRKLFNKAHFGFGNSELNSITGDGAWKIKQYPLTRMLKNRTKLARGVYFSYHDDLYMEGSFIDSDSGVYFEIHPALRTSALDGDIVYSIIQPIRENELYFGHDKLSRKIKEMITSKKVTYSDNETGNLFDKFLNESILGR